MKVGFYNIGEVVVCDYSDTKEIPSYGRVFFAEIDELGPLPSSEITRTPFIRD